MKKITLIGAGNVGHHLANRLKQMGHQICQIYSRTLQRATTLADLVAAQPINKWQQVTDEADIYLIAVKDDGIATAIKHLSKKIPHKIIAHTSGATPSLVFEGHFEQFGVFYPLQTISQLYPIDFDCIPFCIDGNTETVKGELVALAQSIVPNVYRIDDEQRQILHVAAVFLNNFTNHLLTISEDICEKEGISFEILKPLLNETVRKVSLARAADLQTGPAIRGDQRTIDRHLDYLEKFPDYQAVYKLMTEKIRE